MYYATTPLSSGTTLPPSATATTTYAPKNDEENFTVYVETFFLVLLFLGGAPSNLIIARCLQQKTQAGNTAWYLLVRHLNATDLLIVCIYVPFQIATKLTGNDWHAGEVLCRVTSMINVLVFYASSNVIVCIAVDKVCNYRPQHSTGNKRMRRVRRLLGVAWFLAVVSSLPQLFVQHVAVHDRGPKCVDVWFFDRIPSNNTTGVQHFDITKISDIYFLSHLLVVFWLPFLIIAVCYGVLFCRILCFSQRYGRRRWDSAALPPSDPPSTSRSHTTNLSQAALGATTPCGDETHKQHARALRHQSARVLRITLVLLTSYSVCWLPYNCVTLVSYVEMSESIALALRFLSQFIVLNSVLNPYVYGVCGILDVCMRSAPAPTNTMLDELALF